MLVMYENISQIFEVRYIYLYVYVFCKYFSMEVLNRTSRYD